MLVHTLLRSGDLVFINIDNALYRRVGVATASRATHVGIAFRDSRGAWLVAESTVPLSRYTPLERFLARSAGQWAVIRRLRGGLVPEQVSALRRACDARMRVPYHLGFDYGSPRLFCSKLVYDAYREGLGVEVGTLETFEQMLRKRPDTPLAFWRLWFLGRIPWSRQTVSPASQLNSDRLETVYSTP